MNRCVSDGFENAKIDAGVEGLAPPPAIKQVQHCVLRIRQNCPLVPDNFFHGLQDRSELRSSATQAELSNHNPDRSSTPAATFLRVTVIARCAALRYALETPSSSTGFGRSRPNLKRRHAVPDPIFSPHRSARHNTASRRLQRTSGMVSFADPGLARVSGPVVLSAGSGQRYAR